MLKGKRTRRTGKQIWNWTLPIHVNLRKHHRWPRWEGWGGSSVRAVPHCPWHALCCTSVPTGVGFVTLTPYPKSRLQLGRGCPAPWTAWKRRVWRKQGRGSATLTLACLWWHPGPWSSRLCGSLNLKPNLKAPSDWGAGHHGWHRQKQHGVSKVGACLLPPWCLWSCRICFSDPYQSSQTKAEAPSQLGLHFLCTNAFNSNSVCIFLYILCSFSSLSFYY